MSVLSTVTKGKIQTPEMLCLYGPDGIGKSTFAAQMPNPIFLGPEKGTANLDVARFPSPNTFEEVEKYLLALHTEKHDYKTLAIDSADWIEPLIHDKMCRDYGVRNVEEAGGGYGKWVAISVKMWSDFLKRLGALREQKGMNIIILAHSQVKTFQDPQQNASYDRYQLKLQDKASALIREFVDCVLFANFETYTKLDANKKTKAFGDGTRKMYTERRPGFDAKNRFNLPQELPLSFADYMTAKNGSEKVVPENLLKSINELMAQLSDEELKTKVGASVTKAGNDTAKLNVILNRLRTLLGS
jgi:hypothetical protein